MAMPGWTEWLILIAIIAAVVYGIRRLARRRDTRGFEVMPRNRPDQTDRQSRAICSTSCQPFPCWSQCKLAT